MAVVRKRFPGFMDPKHAQYGELKHQCRLALSELAADIEEEQHA